MSHSLDEEGNQTTTKKVADYIPPAVYNGSGNE